MILFIIITFHYVINCILYIFIILYSILSYYIMFYDIILCLLIYIYVLYLPSFWSVGAGQCHQKCIYRLVFEHSVDIPWYPHCHSLLANLVLSNLLMSFTVSTGSR